MPDKNYIVIPHSVFNEDYENDSEDGKHLSVEELYLYAWLYRRRVPHEWNIETTIDTIHAFCITFAKGNDSRNKKYIRSLLLSLDEKNYIDVYTELGFDSKTKYNEPLFIDFPKVTDGYNSNISYASFDYFSDPLDFCIYAYIDRFGDTGRKVSYYKFSKIMRRSETTVKEAIKRMNHTKSLHTKTLPRIWKFSGEYYESNAGIKKFENRYYTRPSEKIKKEWDRLYKNQNVSYEEDMVLLEDDPF